MHGEYHIRAHRAHKAVHAPVKIALLARIQGHEGHVHVVALHLLQLQAVIFAHTEVVRLRLAGPHPVVQIACVVNPFAPALHQKGHALVRGLHGPHVNRGREIDGSLLVRPHKQNPAAQLLRRPLAPDIVAEDIQNLLRLVRQLKNHRRKMISMAMTGKYHQRFVKNLRQLSLKIVEQKRCLVHFHQK